MEILLSAVYIAGRALASVAALFLISRIIGVRQISQLTFYDYAVGISIGSIAAMGIDGQIPFQDVVIGLAVYGIFTILIAFLTRKSLPLRRLISGKPSMLIMNGEIQRRVMEQHNYDLDDLLLMCRKAGYFTLSDIAYAVLETDGTLSILPRSSAKPVTVGDMNFSKPETAPEYNLIIDGEVMTKNLSGFGRDMKWLNSQLSAAGIVASEVFLGVGTADGKLKIYLKNNAQNGGDIFV